MYRQESQLGVFHNSHLMLLGINLIRQILISDQIYFQQIMRQIIIEIRTKAMIQESSATLKKVSDKIATYNKEIKVFKAMINSNKP
jgi:hypothetical protein